MKKVLKAILCAVLALVLVVGGYVAYVFIAYHRLDDNLPLDVVDNTSAKIEAGREYKVVSFNIGFGAYEDDFGFFMDGGDRAWAWSPERLDKNIAAIGDFLNSEDADLLLVQEIDVDATRSYHRDELTTLRALLAGKGYDNVFAENWDSPFLFYPILQPHGAAKAGIGTFAKYNITSSLRRSLPLEDSLMKIVDLDRCYSVSRLPSADGRELVLINLHLSAYTTDGTIATEQLRMLLLDMQNEYDKGNWVIAGGDFNKDLLGNSEAWFGKSDIEYSWAQPIPPDTFYGTAIKIVPPFNGNDPVPSCRNADGPYHYGQYVLTVDGFLVSPNVEVKHADVINTHFRYSDHNPVEMTVVLK